MTPMIYLVDTSALARLLSEETALSDWDEPIEEGRLGICPVTEFEILHTARSKADRAELVDALEVAYPWVLMPERVFQRARQVQELLTGKGQHRGPGPVDLLVAATAELTGRVLLHYPRYFERLPKTTGQPAEWLATPGSID